MGVSGCGKTTVGKALAKALEQPFYDADDFHPQENIDKMQSGQSLDDVDRKPWLEHLQRLIAAEKRNGIVLACSALKQSYRNILSEQNNLLIFVHLEGSFELIISRMRMRKHFMPEHLLKSQFAALEPPENAITVPINQRIPDIIQMILEKMERKSDSK